MTADQLLTFGVLAVTGFTACAEFGSYAFVHPVIRRLDVDSHIQVEQGLVRTFGRVMPALMTAGFVVLVLWGSLAGSIPVWLRAVAVAAWGLGLTTTILVNVAINRRTAGWDPVNEPERWRAMRQRWELFQAVRSWAFLASFLLVAGATATRI